MSFLLFFPLVLSFVQQTELKLNASMADSVSVALNEKDTLQTERDAVRAKVEEVKGSVVYQNAQKNSEELKR